MNMTNLLNEKLICLDGTAADSTEAINLLGTMMVQDGYIHPSYIGAIHKREINFPTGIVLASCGIALPHATPEDNIFKNGIAVLRLKQPVQFHSMENPDDNVSVTLLFMLALNGSENHLNMLQKLFAIFQQEALVRCIQQTTSAKEVCQLMLDNLK